jgi:acyl transferase domain-containing protein
MTHSDAEHWQMEPQPRDSHLFVLSAADRAQLRSRLLALHDSLARKEDFDFEALAYDLASETAAKAGSSRLAMVAGSGKELQERLRRADERLADARVRRINDIQGIYYDDEPMGPHGRLALLFPGEGGQYLNMLADLLPHFAEVREHFEQCDRISLRQGRAEPISRALFLAPGASEEQRVLAEQELWRLDVAIASMLIADWSIYRVLKNLGVRPDAIGGHSAGEFSALVAAGCLEQGDFLVEQLFALGKVLREEENEGGMADAVLLAVATSRRKAAETIARSGAAVQLAMDNCPHQVVLSGPPDAIAVVEAALQGNGVACERLPFGRPYHTPAFARHLPPVERIYQALPVRQSAVQVYSCVAGAPFPQDPEAIRRLGVEHWVAPVEFARMIENMYADGVRIFIESGPKGHLTSFVQDILRSRPFVAVPANVQHRSGIAQINHLVGQLFANHVPIRLEYLNGSRRKGAQPIGSGDRRNIQDQDPAAQRRGSNTVRTSEVMTRYLAVMEQFLDLQRELTGAFLRCPGNTATPRLAAIRPMLGDVLTHLPGMRLVIRRRIDLNEDLYARDHTLGGRHASALDPAHHGLPVMPMAFSMEMMAEAAAALVPNLRVVRLRNVRLHRWIPLDEDPVSLEVDARILEQSPQSVAVYLRDLGNGSNFTAQEEPSVEAVVELADSYPEAPPAGSFPLTQIGPCKYSPHQLYEGERRMFHGPLFQAACATDRQGAEGIEGRLRALPLEGLFRSVQSPDLLTAPQLIDASTHLLGCWHLGQADPAGRVVFPYEIGSLDLFGPPPAAGTEVLCRVRVEARTARQVRHRIELIGSDCRLLCRLAPAKYWRFYWPQEFVDFIRIKEDYLLAHPWPRLVELSDSLPPHHIARVTEAGPAFTLRLEIADDLCQPVLRASIARVGLSPTEWRQYPSLRTSEDEITRWLYGRLAAKDVARAVWWRQCGERLRPADLEVVQEVDGAAVVIRRGAAPAERVWVAVTHVPGAVLATQTTMPRAPSQAALQRALE